MTVHICVLVLYVEYNISGLTCLSVHI